MKEVIAIIRMNAIQKTKRAVADLGLPSVTAEKVFGRGKQKGLHLFPAANINPEDSKGNGMRYVPKRMLTMVVPDENVEEAIEAIMVANRTGMIGDGRIFVCPVEEAIRIRTGERGKEAI
ncbi:MAG: putative nitrogen regulatory PII-like protein [Candidatus Methanophagaceae archaeon]|nr:MAG: putative nitrogen regulatory PII-like protein [Methanophagales archaeon]KAF5436005.1 nitrogen regulatory protein PII 2 [Methanophagales archaeon]